MVPLRLCKVGEEAVDTIAGRDKIAQVQKACLQHTLTTVFIHLSPTYNLRRNGLRGLWDLGKA